MIHVQGLHKSYGANPVLRGIDLTIREKETVVLIGRSGCGKTTLLRCLNSLETFDRGKVTIADTVLERPLAQAESEKVFQEKAGKVRVQAGMVFQSFNLFPHLTVLENLMLAPQVVKKASQEEAEALALSLLGKVGLSSHASHYPSQLSGGQSQRDAIARALAMNPKIMLYDEPTSALDPGLVDEVLEVMKKLSEEGLTQVVVTHEMRFARDVADRVVYIEEGIVIEDSPADQIFKAPKDPRTQRFLARFL